MSEKTLEEILHQLRNERIACEQVLSLIHGLASGELKEVFDKAITLAKLEAQVDNSEVSTELKEIISYSTNQIILVSSQLESGNILLQKRTEELKRFQRRCIMLASTCFALAFSCSIFIGWTGYSYWLVKATTSSFWFQKIIIENAEVIDKCLNPDVVKHSNGKCTIELPVKTIQNSKFKVKN